MITLLSDFNHFRYIFYRFSVVLILTHLCLMESSTLTPWTGSFQNKECLDSFLLLHVPCCIEIPVFNANSVDPDQTPHFAAS